MEIICKRHGFDLTPTEIHLKGQSHIDVDKKLNVIFPVTKIFQTASHVFGIFNITMGLYKYDLTEQDRAHCIFPLKTITKKIDVP